MGKRYLAWEELTITWETVPYIWEDVAVVTEVFDLLGSGSGIELREKEPWKDVEKKVPQKLAKKFLDIVVRVNGITFEESRELDVKKNITVDHIQKTFDAFEKKIVIKADVKKKN